MTSQRDNLKTNQGGVNEVESILKYILKSVLRVSLVSSDGTMRAL